MHIVEHYKSEGSKVQRSFVVSLTFSVKLQSPLPIRSNVMKIELDHNRKSTKIIAVKFKSQNAKNFKFIPSSLSRPYSI